MERKETAKNGIYSAYNEEKDCARTVTREGQKHGLKTEISSVRKENPYLTDMERRIISAMNGNRICDVSSQTYMPVLVKAIMRIASDVGYNYKVYTEMEWSEKCKRVASFVAEYYSVLTAKEVYLSFELSEIGYLNPYLPHDSNGNPDNRHYNQFSIGYFAKVLNAYKLARNEIVAKITNEEPEIKKPEATQIEKYESHLTRRIEEVFLCYKYTGKLDFGYTNPVIIYSILERINLAGPIKENESDRSKSFAKYLKRVSRKFVNPDRAFYVRRQGKESRELDFDARSNAMEREIKRAFDEMIKEEVQIEEILRKPRKNK